MCHGRSTWGRGGTRLRPQRRLSTRSPHPPRRGSSQASASAAAPEFRPDSDAPSQAQHALFSVNGADLLWAAPMPVPQLQLQAWARLTCAAHDRRALPARFGHAEWPPSLAAPRAIAEQFASVVLVAARAPCAREKKAGMRTLAACRDAAAASWRRCARMLYPAPAAAEQRESRGSPHAAAAAVKSSSPAAGGAALGLHAGL